ncbi:MAG: hypothetical protein PHG23_01885 [Candidatus Pacebacteria bacterium]|nr:hypothetical protein [Candidatus Paceibacterota bacterium]
MRKQFPYTLKILIPVIGWVALCSSFAYVLTLSIANLNGLGREIYLIGIPAVLVFLGLFATTRYSNFPFSAEQAKAINRGVYRNAPRENMSAEEIKNFFYYLVYFSRGLFSSIIWGGLVLTVLISGLEFWQKTSPADILIVVSGGVIATVLSAIFASFYSEQAAFPLVKACRMSLLEKQEHVPDINFDSVTSKFYFLFLFPVITATIVLISVFPFNLNVAILSVIGIVMIFIIDRILYIYISKSLSEAESFIGKIAEGEAGIFATGSVDREFFVLTERLNGASRQIAEARSESYKTKKEMEGRVDELEKFFDLTVNRELKMVELKKEIKKEKEKNLTRKGNGKTKGIQKDDAA